MWNVFPTIIVFYAVVMPIYSQHLTKFPTDAHSLLWKIEGKNVKGDSYIFGTMHLIDKDDFYFPEKLTTIVSSSELIVTEIPYNDGRLASDDSLLLLPEGESLFDKFTSQQVESLVEWGTKRLGMPFDPDEWKQQFQRYKPFVMAQIVFYETAIYDTAKEKGYVEFESYEREIFWLYIEHNIKDSALETIAQQIHFLDMLSEEQQVALVMGWINDPQKQLVNFQQLTAIYLQQNVDEIYQFVHKNNELLPETSSLLLAERNRSWIPKIERFIAQNNTFIAVGAAHLGGEDGILRLLERKGYTLTPVKF